MLSALNDENLAENALLALAAVSTKSVQQQLAILAIDESAETELRESAAVQLTFHILRFGAMLSERDVLAVRASWKSATDPAVSTALASVLGSLKPDAKRVGERLQKFAAPTITNEQP